MALQSTILCGISLECVIAKNAISKRAKRRIQPSCIIPSTKRSFIVLVSEILNSKIFKTIDFNFKIVLFSLKRTRISNCRCHTSSCECSSRITLFPNNHKLESYFTAFIIPKGIKINMDASEVPSCEKNIFLLKSRLDNIEKQARDVPYFIYLFIELLFWGQYYWTTDGIDVVQSLYRRLLCQH